MKPLKNRFALIVAALFSLCVIATCTFINKSIDTESIPIQTENHFEQWKKEKLKLQANYESKILKLQQVKDSLQKTVIEKKKALAEYRFKATYLQSRLSEAIGKADSTGSCSDSLQPIANQYFEKEARKDSACNETITGLELVVANRDSLIVIHKQVETNLRDILKEQAEREQQLTAELNTAYKHQRRKVIQNKFLSAGLIFLSGLTTTLLIKQTLK